MKYIVFQCKSEGKPTMHVGVTFPDVMVHEDVARAIERVKVQPMGPFSDWWLWPKAVSAGFVTNGICMGYSESLKLTAHPEDSLILKDGRGIGFQERPVDGK